MTASTLTGGCGAFVRPFLCHLGTIHDPRRAEGKLYQLPYVLLFSILAIVTGANSYRGIRTFIKTHLKRLNKALNIGWKKPPAHTAIRYILRLPGGIYGWFGAGLSDVALRGSEPASCSILFGACHVHLLGLWACGQRFFSVVHMSTA